MQIKVDSRDLGKLVAGLERMQRQIPAAIARGLNEGGDKTRTKVQRALKEQTGVVRYGSVTSRVRTKRAFAGAGGLSSYEIIVNGRATKVFEFKSAVTKGPGGGVTVWMWNAAHKFKRSFEGSGKIAGQLKMRTLGPRLPTRSFDGPNMAKEAVKDKSAEAFFATAETEVPAAVVKQMAKSL
jgi:hypothetical protein